MSDDNTQEIRATWAGFAEWVAKVENEVTDQLVSPEVEGPEIKFPRPPVDPVIGFCEPWYPLRRPISYPLLRDGILQWIEHMDDVAGFREQK